MMTMAVSDLPFPRPKCPASLNGLSCLSRVSGAELPTAPASLAEDEVEGPLFSEDEYQALMISEFGLRAPVMLLADGEIQAMMAAENEIQASPPPQAPAPLLPVAPCPDNQDHIKKRKRPPLPPPPSSEDAEKDEAQPQPPLRQSKRPKKKLPSRRALNKMVATRILDREFRAPEPSEGRTVLWCQCQELPRDCPGCALHQDAPCRSWMTTRGHFPTVGGAGAVLVPKHGTDRRSAVTQYVRWRGRVWMPSRFYVEQAQVEMALQDDNDFMVLAD